MSSQQAFSSLANKYLLYMGMGIILWILATILGAIVSTITGYSEVALETEGTTIYINITTYIVYKSLELFIDGTAWIIKLIFIGITWIWNGWILPIVKLIGMIPFLEFIAKIPDLNPSGFVAAMDQWNDFLTRIIVNTYLPVAEVIDDIVDAVIPGDGNRRPFGGVDE